jgi:hypothetical protein
MILKLLVHAKESSAGSFDKFTVIEQVNVLIIPQYMHW